MPVQPVQHEPRTSYKILVIVTHDLLRFRVRLAGRACVHCVEFVAMLGKVFERVGLMELKWVSRLRINVDPDNLEPCPPVSFSGTTLPAEQIQKLWCGHRFTTRYTSSKLAPGGLM